MTAKQPTVGRFPPHVLREYSLLADGERGILVGPRGDFVWMALAAGSRRCSRRRGPAAPGHPGSLARGRPADPRHDRRGTDGPAARRIRLPLPAGLPPVGRYRGSVRAVWVSAGPGHRTARRTRFGGKAFERNRAACGPPGLFAEEYDINQRQLRGDLPQALVHALLLESAHTLSPTD